MVVVSPLTRISDFANRSALWIAVAIGLSIPVSTALDNVLVAALMLCWIASAHYRDKLAVLRAQAFVLFPIGFFVLHVAGALYSVGDWQEIARALDKASVVLLIPILVSLGPSEAVRERALQAFMAAMLLTLVLSFLIWLDVLQVGGVIKGIPEDPSVFKMHITHGVLMAFTSYAFGLKALLASGRRARLLLGLVAALAAANVLFMVHGRSGQLVLLALLAYLVCSQLRWRGLVVAAAVGASVAGATYFVPSSALHERAKASIEEFQDWRVGKPATLRNMRLESWGTSLAIVRENPLVGVGTGGFKSAYERHVSGTSMLVVGQPENQYLLTAVQLGALGLTALLALLAGQWHLAGRLASREDAALARGLVIMIGVGCLFNSFLLDHTEALFYAWLSGLLFAGRHRAHDGPPLEGIEVLR